MSTAEVESPATDEVVEEEIVAVSPSRRALEVAAFVTALASIVLYAYYALYLYTAVKLQKAQGGAGPTWTQIVQYLGSLLTNSYTTVVLALISLALVAIIRALYEDQRSHDRTVASATISIVSGVVSLFFFIYNAIEILIHGDSQLGTTGQAKFTVMTSHIAGVILSIGVLAIAIIFVTSRDDNDDLDNEISFEADEAAAVEESAAETNNVPEATPDVETGTVEKPEEK